MLALVAIIVLVVISVALGCLCICLVKAGRECVKEETEKRGRTETLLDTFINHCDTCGAINADIIAARKSLIETALAEIQNDDTA